ncbi:hypothetical protein ACFSBX_00730 [Halobellus rarus]|uniref:Integrase n=1 Tax=Halobellus rarus TaxID=1126237 RepID=A0ABD6CJE3_9EURY
MPTNSTDRLQYFLRHYTTESTATVSGYPHPPRISLETATAVYHSWLQSLPGGTILSRNVLEQKLRRLGGSEMLSTLSRYWRWPTVPSRPFEADATSAVASLADHLAVTTANE